MFLSILELAVAVDSEISEGVRVSLTAEPAAVAYSVAPAPFCIESELLGDLIDSLNAILVAAERLRARPDDDRQWEIVEIIAAESRRASDIARRLSVVPDPGRATGIQLAEFCEAIKAIERRHHNECLACSRAICEKT